MVRGVSAPAEDSRRIRRSSGVPVAWAKKDSVVERDRAALVFAIQFR
jgi:hypothetical protein